MTLTGRVFFFSFLLLIAICRLTAMLSTSYISMPVHDWPLTGDVVLEVKLQPSILCQDTRGSMWLSWIIQNELEGPACRQCELFISYRLLSQSNNPSSVYPNSQKMALFGCKCNVSRCWKGVLVIMKWWLIWGKGAWPLIFALNKADCAYLCAPPASLSACQNVILLPSLNIKLWNTSCK